MINLTRRGIAILIASIIVIGAIAGAGLYRGSNGDDNSPVDIVGNWYLVGSISYDKNGQLYKSVNSNMNMKITGTNDQIVYGKAQTNRNFDNGTPFVAYFSNGLFISEYNVGDGIVSVSGNAKHGCLITQEIHHYKGSDPADPDDDKEFVFINTYSKDPNGKSYCDTAVPNVNKSWKLWSGETGNSTWGEQVPLEGSNFFIHEQYGRLFRAEMQQFDGGSVETVTMIGVIQETDRTDGIRSAMAVDTSSDSITTWNLIFNDDTLYMCAVTESSITGHVGDLVCVERVYTNSQLPGPPTDLKDREKVMGTWTTESKLRFTSAGGKLTEAEHREITYSEHYSARYLGTGVKGTDPTVEVGYLLPYSTSEDGVIQVVSCRVLTNDYTGYQWFSGEKLCRMVFSVTANEVTYYELTKS